MTVAEALQLARNKLEPVGIESYRAEALQLLEALGLPRLGVLTRLQQVLTPSQEVKLRDWLERRSRREPLQHILGIAPFYGLELTVAPEVLIPRPETERLVELALLALEPVVKPKILDIGTGSGAIALALGAERPDAEVWATDISSKALAIAEANAEKLNLTVTFKSSDLLTAPSVAAFARSADLLLCNPPYLPEADQDALSPEVRADPPQALFSGADGMDHFMRLEAQAFALLKPAAHFMLELDPRNVEKALALSRRWTKSRIEKDLTGRERFLLLRR
jgi:release factor glutamine methyltransferase